MKQIFWLLLFTAFVVLSIEAADETPKVKIGIKKRITDCKSKAKKGDFVHVHYKGTLQDGTEFDSSYTRNVAFTFSLGGNQVIAGWDVGLLGMCEGEIRRLVIPPELGYGKSGSGNKIPPDSTLIFDIELIKIEPREDL